MSNNTQLDVAAALQPNRSVVVEACAGSGKTWLLVSRIITTLLSGAEPSQILAITFTRKASHEMQERLHQWLKDLSTGSESFVIDFLKARGIANPDATIIHRARGLYAAVLFTQPGITISTFHGWFMQVLQRAPLNADVLQGMTLLDNEASTMNEARDEYLDMLRRNPDCLDATCMRILYKTHGLFTTDTLLGNFMAKRSEWFAYTEGQSDPLSFALSELKTTLAVDLSQKPDAAWGADSDSSDILRQFAAQIQKVGTATQVKKGKEIDDAWLNNPEEARFAAVWPLLFTQGGEPRKLKPTKQQDETAFMSALGELQSSLQAVQDAIAEQRSYLMNEAVMTCGVSLLAKYQAIKRQKQQMDFADLEWELSKLLRQSEHAETMQYKLDSRYRHVLLDEFQDTNPLQWRIMRAWFDASAAVDNQPSVFIVGDPKQSIYRFRRAEPRLFSAARDYLQANFGAVAINNNMSRRSAEQIVSAVNTIFQGNPAGFEHQEHETSQIGLPGHVEVLPLCLPDEKIEADSQATTGIVLRDPLTQGRAHVVTSVRHKEASQFADHIQSIVGSWAVMDGGVERHARYSDIMVLVRNRTNLSIYEEALKAKGIPFISTRRGGLLETLEAVDMQALLNFLVTPFADLSLAHALKSPIFGCSDDDLQDVALLGGDSASCWWEKIQSMQNCSPSIVRAKALLGTWLDMSNKLPVHDLLDRIYSEGDLLRRYAESLEEGPAAQALANLNLFIELSLNIDGGRYPSLPKFIRELANLRELENNSPDEGKLGTLGNAVKIYTVHEAKGLESPIVWILDANQEKSMKDGFDALVHWPAHSEKPLHFSMFAGQAARGKQRASMFDEEEAMQAREEMNLLYVAMTRAKQALIVSGSGKVVKAEDDDNDDSPSWYDRIAAVCTVMTNPLVKPVAGIMAKSSSAGKVVVLPKNVPVGKRVQQPCELEAA